MPYLAASIALFFVSGDKVILVPLSGFALILGLSRTTPSFAFIHPLYLGFIFFTAFVDACAKG
jgi:hypothetical protein